MNQWLGVYASSQQERPSPQPRLRAPQASHVVTLRHLSLPSGSPPTALQACRGFPSRLLSLGLAFSLGSRPVPPGTPSAPVLTRTPREAVSVKLQRASQRQELRCVPSLSGLCFFLFTRPPILIHPHLYLQKQDYFSRKGKNKFKASIRMYCIMSQNRFQSSVLTVLGHHLLRYPPSWGYLGGSVG